MCRVASRSRVPLSGAGRGQHRLCVGGLFNNKQTVCGRFITNRSARASKDHRCIFGLQTSSHSPGPRCVTRQQTDFVPNYKKIFYKKNRAVRRTAGLDRGGSKERIPLRTEPRWGTVLHRAHARCLAPGGNMPWLSRRRAHGEASGTRTSV